MSFAKRARELALVTLVSTALFLVLGEVFLRVYLTRRIFYDVEMSRYARSLKVDAENPLIGHVHRPNSQAELMGVKNFGQTSLEEIDEKLGDFGLGLRKLE